MAAGDPEATISYAVTVHADAHGETLNNVATPGTPGGECPVSMPDLANPFADPPAVLLEPDDCDTTDRVRDVNLGIEKTHAPIPEGAVDTGKDEVISYTITVTNTGQDPAEAVTVTDPLPTGLSYVEGTLSAPDGWTAAFSDSVFIADYPEQFMAGEVAVFTFDVSVGALPRPSESDPYPPIVNTACVSEGAGTDNIESDNCASVTTPVKTIAVEADAVCRADTPYASYSVTPFNVADVPTISLIWWTLDAYENRDPSIDAGDAAALLADGASQVDPIDVPSGWADGTPLEGQLLWPGAAVDAAGNPIAWPGWTQNPDGSWVLDPNAPFYNLRGEAVMEIRINPSSAAVVVYPPATPNCNATPPTNPPVPPTPPTPPTPWTTPVNTPRSGWLASTGSDAWAAWLGGLGLLTLGLVLGLPALRRRARGGGRV
ncbi:DUF11 domain-containing protein [Leucobacter insecticola]|uniref:DUF11 domain-containing protein n=1 Tax=Leucobacter insecticola TaxID=2714934 RepID=A0A6G8FGV6_9MICO|nr:DUF11 domain-containing protein [Leucobacter insecticola]QIM15584.1 DUF11 domain-containing protein [Leucobacter insecticola]